MTLREHCKAYQDTAEDKDLRLVAQLYHLWREGGRITILGTENILQIQGCRVTIEVTGDWTKGKLHRYGGDTIHQAVQKAHDDHVEFRGKYPMKEEDKR